MYNEHIPPTHIPLQVQNALKLAYIKLDQLRAFRQLDAIQPDPQAQRQILEAIHTFDPDFIYPEPEEQRDCRLCGNKQYQHYTWGGRSGFFCKPNPNSAQYTPVEAA